MTPQETITKLQNELDEEKQKRRVLEEECCKLKEELKNIKTLPQTTPSLETKLNRYESNNVVKQILEIQDQMDRFKEHISSLNEELTKHMNESHSYYESEIKKCIDNYETNKEKLQERSIWRPVKEYAKMIVDCKNMCEENNEKRKKALKTLKRLELRSDEKSDKLSSSISDMLAEVKSLTDYREKNLMELKHVLNCYEEESSKYEDVLLDIKKESNLLARLLGACEEP